MLLRQFNRCDHYLCSSYFQPMDPAYLTYEKMISMVNRLHSFPIWLPRRKPTHMSHFHSWSLISLPC
ncbi:unnamed protein product [Hymenolepis diminuta]|uniref:Uncharacterized protein n=1 Tax=Hymenolepis diminuta TaxID=6216 RepID=A0A564Y992_HYMDI|nr:unnamed protein product [Hymenolepis diminuta]